MDIGIITVYNVPNYGSYLQALALKKALEAKGHRVFHYKMYSDRETRRSFYKYPVTRRSLKYPGEEFRKYLFGRKKYKLFREADNVFREVDFATLQKMDLVIIGSDELWNIKEEQFCNLTYFGAGLHHVMTYGISVSRASMDDFRAKPEYMDAVCAVKYITARDDATRSIVRQITGRNVPIVCDPTFLVPLDQLMEPCLEAIRESPYLLVYTYYFTYPEWMKDYLVRFAKEKHVRLVSVGFYFDWCDDCINCTPEQFPDVIRQAKYFVTTTFHGTVFGILNHKTITAVPFSQKVTDLMQKMDLGEEIVSDQPSYDDFCRIVQRDAPDYSHVDQILKNMAQDSGKILDAMLQEVKA